MTERAGGPGTGSERAPGGPSEPGTWGIAELARAFGVTPRTLRFYESEGLLAPLRRGARRLYRPRERTRLRLILRGRRLGFSLAEVREILDLYDRPPGERAQLARLLERIAARRAALEARRGDLEATLADLDKVARNCRKRLKELEESEVAPAPKRSRSRAR